MIRRPAVGLDFLASSKQYLATICADDRLRPAQKR
jgi:hypothetical protein